jgi:hypothetical protein
MFSRFGAFEELLRVAGLAGFVASFASRGILP